MEAISHFLYIWPKSNAGHMVILLPEMLSKNSSLSHFGNHDARNHVTGRSQYVDDLPVLSGTVFLKIVDAGIAHGHIVAIDTSLAEEVEGLVKIFDYQDIPGENQIGGIYPDEPLLADHEIHFRASPS